MDENQKKAFDELTGKVKDAVLPIVTKDVLKSVMDEMPWVMTNGDTSKEKEVKEQKEKAAEYFKGVIEGDRSKVRAHAKAEVFGNESTSTKDRN